MSVTGLHPEHLLEKELTGALSDGERSQLDAHLGQCAACRFERVVRGDFAADLEADDAPLRTSGLIREIVESAPRSEQAAAPRPSPRGRRTRLAWMLAAAATLVVATAVASEPARRVWMPLFGLSAPAPAAPAVLHEAAPPPTVVIVQATAVAPASATPPAAVEPPPSAAPAPAPATPEALLGRESDARRRGDYDRAIALHSDLVTRFPASKEAQVSRVTVARMLLDRGEPSSALVGFEAYLAHGGGELADEARVGRATALERLGRKSEARAAWRGVLDADERGPYAAEARARIEALER